MTILSKFYVTELKKRSYIGNSTKTCWMITFGTMGKFPLKSYIWKNYNLLRSPKTNPVMMALRRVALSSSDLKKMDDEKSSGSDVDKEESSWKKSFIGITLITMNNIINLDTNWTLKINCRFQTIFNYFIWDCIKIKHYLLNGFSNFPKEWK